MIKRRGAWASGSEGGGCIVDSSPASNASTRVQGAPAEPLLPRSALDDMLPRLCELMAEFMIAVPIESGDELLAPALLPATRPPELDEWTAGWSEVRLTAELYPQAPPGLASGLCLDMFRRAPLDGERYGWGGRCGGAACFDKILSTVLVTEVKVGGGDECDRMIIRCLFQVAQGASSGDGDWERAVGAAWDSVARMRRSIWGRDGSLRDFAPSLRRMVSETVWISVGRGADGKFPSKDVSDGALERVTRSMLREGGRTHSTAVDVLTDRPASCGTAILVTATCRLRSRICFERNSRRTMGTPIPSVPRGRAPPWEKRRDTGGAPRYPRMKPKRLGYLHQSQPEGGRVRSGRLGGEAAKQRPALWIDTNALCPNKGGMKRGVESSDVFCLFLTKGLFHSYYVRLELSGQSKRGNPSSFCTRRMSLSSLARKKRAPSGLISRRRCLKRWCGSSIEPRKTM